MKAREAATMAADGVSASEIHEIVDAGLAAGGSGDYARAAAVFVSIVDGGKAPNALAARAAMNAGLALVGSDDPTGARTRFEQAKEWGESEMAAAATAKLEMLDRNAAAHEIVDALVAADT